MSLESDLGIQNLAVFMVSGLLLNITPGPDSILIMTRSASQGWRAGSAAALGIGAGTMVHVVAAAWGLSALMATSATAFGIMKWIGAAYLIYLGAMFWRQTPAADVAPVQACSPLTHARIFYQGFLTNVLNPKVALFFMAFVPQFIDPNATHQAGAFLVLGSLFNINSMLWCHVLALSSAVAGQRFRMSLTAKRWLNRCIGTLLLSFGIKLALADQR
jgi:threonine/homoserine/homoserine lactone efflux protein